MRRTDDGSSLTGVRWGLLAIVLVAAAQRP